MKNNFLRKISKKIMPRNLTGEKIIFVKNKHFVNFTKNIQFLQILTVLKEI